MGESHKPLSAYSVLSSTAVLFVVLYGIWTLYVWVATVAGWSFTTLVEGAPWVGLAALAALFFRRFFTSEFARPEREPDAEAGRGPTMGLPGQAAFLAAGTAFAVPGILITFGRVEGSFLVPWLLLTASSLLLALVVVSRGKPRMSPEQRPAAARSSLPEWAGWIPYLALVLLAVTLYGLSGATDADDTHFLGTARALLEYPEAPLFSQDPIFGRSGLENHIFKLNIGQSWEALAAFLAHATGVELLVMYYQVLPLVLCALIPVPAYLFLHRYFGATAWIGVLVAILFLIAWGTFNHNAGHFFIPRLYQGKSLLVAIFLPLAFWMTRSYALSPSYRKLGVLTLLLIASGGAASTGLYLAPIAVAVAFAAFAPLRLKPFLVGGALLVPTLIPNLLMIGYVKLGLMELLAAPDIGWVNSQANFNTSIYWAYGDGKHLAFFLVLFWLGFAGIHLLKSASVYRSELVRLWVLLVVILLNHPLSELLSQLTGVGNLQWRWHWALPAMLVLGFLAASAASATSEALRTTRRAPERLFSGAYSIGVAGLLALFLLINVEHVTRSYADRWVLYKVNQDALEVAELVKQHHPQGRVLVDYRIAEILPFLDWSGTLVASRELYWGMPYFTPEERLARAQLQDLVNRKEAWTDDETTRFLSRVEARDIRLVVARPDGGLAHRRKALEGTGWDCVTERDWLWCQPSIQ